MKEYRLSWEMPDPIEVDAYEQLNGKNCWQRFPWESFRLTWRSHTKVTQDESVVDQHATLAAWAESHEQPIRNVRLEVREVVNADEGWVLA